MKCVTGDSTSKWESISYVNMRICFFSYSKRLTARVLSWIFIFLKDLCDCMCVCVIVCVWVCLSLCIHILDLNGCLRGMMELWKRNFSVNVEAIFFLIVIKTVYNCCKLTCWMWKRTSPCKVVTVCLLMFFWYIPDCMFSNCVVYSVLHNLSR